MKSVVVENIKKLQAVKVTSPFDCRITALAWHPRWNTSLAVASKGGDIMLFNHKYPSSTNTIRVEGVISLILK